MRGADSLRGKEGLRLGRAVAACSGAEAAREGKVDL